MFFKALADTGVFKDFERFFIGFDDHFGRLAQLSAELAKQVSNFPPTNVFKVHDNRYVIEMAVAGFGKDDIDVRLVDGKLVINGKIKGENASQEQYLFQGIANRAFTRVFVLNDRVEVQSAELANGMLKIALERHTPAPSQSRKIDIQD